MEITNKKEKTWKVYSKQVTISNNHTGDIVTLLLKLSGNKIAAVKQEGDFSNCLIYEDRYLQSSWKEGINILNDKWVSCPLHCQISHIQSIEKLANNFIEMPIRALFIRTIILELERIRCHLEKIGIISWNISYPLLSNKVMTLKNNLDMELNLFNNSFFTIGGVREDLEINKLKMIFNITNLLEKKVNRMIKNVQRNIFLKNYLKEVGFLSRDSAKKLSLVGPMARSSGITMDIRKSDPYAGYSYFDFSIPVSDFCDIFGEFQILFDEIIESIKIIKDAIRNIPNGEHCSRYETLELISGSTIMRVESPAGTIFNFIQSKNGSLNEKPRIYKIITPIKINSQGILARITGEEIDNLSLILATIGEGWI